MSRTKTDILSPIKDQVEKARFVDHNTLHVHYKNGTEAIRLHDTDILTLKDRQVVFDSGGWRTPTTKDRLQYQNPFMPGVSVNIWQREGLWYMSVDGNSYDYYDGITFSPKGKLLSKNKTIDLKKVRELKKKIAKFCKLITKDNLPQPASGDCWFCLMTDRDGKTMGDLSSNHDHLYSHMEEGYVVGSLLVNAMKETGYRDEQIGFHYSLKIADTFRRAVRKYLQKRLIPNISVK